MATKKDSSSDTDTVEIPADLRDMYRNAKQDHVFRYVDRGVLSPSEASDLFKQLREIDVDRVNRLYKTSMEATKKTSRGKKASKLEPVKTVQVLASADAKDVTKWTQRGLAAIAKGSLGVIIMAGGQGTRLGFDRPKGEYDIKLPSKKCLFRLQAERIVKLEELAAGYGEKPKVHVYLMTSPQTHVPTMKAWKRENFYGLQKEQVFFFQQGTLPCLTVNGKIMLESAGKVAMAPDGNGGIYLGLHKSGAMKHMIDNGIESVFVGAIDNAVSKIGDPVFVGFCLEKKADVGNKVCTKCGPHEKVGIQVLRDGVPAVVEYSDLDPKIAELRNSSGNLVFSAGNVCIHYYSIDFLKNTCRPELLPEEFHIARKKIPYADEHGATVPKSRLTENTGIKLESFIFDIFSKSQNLVVFEVEREDEFSPVKNAPGAKADSPDTARGIISALHKKWLKNAGATFTSSGAPHDSLLCEISPLVSYAGEGLESFSGKSFDLPCLIQLGHERVDAGKYALATGGGGSVRVYSSKGSQQGCELSSCVVL